MAIDEAVYSGRENIIQMAEPLYRIIETSFNEHTAADYKAAVHSALEGRPLHEVDAHIAKARMANGNFLHQLIELYQNRYLTSSIRKIQSAARKAIAKDKFNDYSVKIHELIEAGQTGDQLFIFSVELAASYAEDAKIPIPDDIKNLRDEIRAQFLKK